MRPNSATSLNIREARPNEQTAASKLLLCDLPGKVRRRQLQHVLADVRQDRLAAAGLLVAERDDRIVGATFGRIQPGRTAAIIAPQLAAGEVESTAHALLEQLSEFLRQRQVVIAQTLAETDQGVDVERLHAAGYRHMADLLYLVAGEAALPDAAPAIELELECYRPQAQQRLCGIIERTYVGTRDCPALEGLRAAGDVVAGFAAIGNANSQHWLIARRDACDVGCVLVADHAHQDQCELVYMGLAPEARGRRWGIQLVRWAQWLTRSAGRPRIVLAVDAANAPAISVYSAAGFVTWDRRSAFLRVF